MSLFERVKKFYNLGIYHEKEVGDFVKKGKLTPEQYREITGGDYD